MSIDVAVTDPRIYERANLLRKACADAGGEEVVEGIYSFETRDAADFFKGAAMVYLPGALITVGDIDELIPPDEVLGLDPLGTFVAKEVKRRRDL